MLTVKFLRQKPCFYLNIFSRHNGYKSGLTGQNWRSVLRVCPGKHDRKLTNVPLFSIFLNFLSDWFSRIDQDQSVFRCDEYPEIYSTRINSGNKLRVDQSASGKWLGKLEKGKIKLMNQNTVKCSNFILLRNFRLFKILAMENFAFNEDVITMTHITPAN